jgi:hypothetical protein
MWSGQVQDGKEDMDETAAGLRGSALPRFERVMTMQWTMLDFGKHEGKTLPQIVFVDPSWFFSAYQDDSFDEHIQYRREADEIYRRARAIKIPQEGTEKLLAEYSIYPGFRGGLCRASVVPESRPRHRGSTPTFRRPVFDLSLPWQYRRHGTSGDGVGDKLVLRGVKFGLFGSGSYRLTKDRCAKFFNDDSNFVL